MQNGNDVYDQLINTRLQEKMNCDLIVIMIY